MKLTKTEHFLTSLSKTISPAHMLPPATLFEDDHLYSKILQKNPLSSTLSVLNAAHKTNIRVKSLHEKPTSQNKTFSKMNITPSKSVMKDPKTIKPLNLISRRSTTSEIRIKNLEILNKLKNLCTSYLVNPENLQGKMVKCLIKSLKTLNEY